MSFFGPFDQKAFFYQNCRFDRKKGANDGKRRNEKTSSFFDSRFSQGLISGREEPGRNKTSTLLSSRTHFHLFLSVPLCPRGVFQGHHPCRSPCLGPTPSTDEKRQLKDDKPGIPMIGSQVDCFGVCTRGKIRNTFLVL